ncbi:hypothetical protein KSP35_06560 [Aquihabitans sp. G128]|uniref:hypothetical protein n=1 Tax=Aquihabitans sp. G128 TaxID=2849779 RepID=UPI001C219E55|nr:hypothetical protein [Aquihabitans sp. G128]QXC62457.1 hypothetical protein KSP35_06560 [Aquihabitans sp. G128]
MSGNNGNGGGGQNGGQGNGGGQNGGGGGGQGGGGNGRRKQQNRRRGGNGANKPKPVDLWRPVPQLADPRPIVPAADPTMLLRSLGDPPLHGQGQAAGHYLAAVVERASHLATALAAGSGLLALPELDPTDDE